ncbi:hypothetical protein TKK_0009615 [Trichogramma kaykai]
MFYCAFCPYVTNRLQSYKLHQKNHRNITELFYCGYKKCSKTFKVENYIIHHLQSVHNFESQGFFHAKVKNTSNDSGKYICTVALCRKEIDDHCSLIKHLKYHLNKKQEVTCPYQNCKKAYENLSSFTSHLSRYHKTDMEILDFPISSNASKNHDCINSLEECVSTTLDENPVENIYESGETELADLSIDCTSDNDDESNAIVINFAIFLLKLESELIIPISTINYIVN